MEITVDGTASVLNPDPSDTLAETLKAIDEHVQSSGYRVETFELDGQDAWPEWEAQVGEEPIDAFDELDVQLVSPRELSRNVVGDLRDQFEELLEYTDETIEKLGRDEKKEGYKHLQAVMSHLQQYIDAINQIVLIAEIQLEDIVVDEVPVNELAHRLRRIINDAEEYIKEEELEELSTVAANRLKPLIQNFRDACPLIIEHVETVWPEPDPLS